jgi:hypothetical protein
MQAGPEIFLMYLLWISTTLKAFILVILFPGGTRCVNLMANFNLPFPVGVKHRDQTHMSNINNSTNSELNENDATMPESPENPGTTGEAGIGQRSRRASEEAKISATSAQPRTDIIWVKCGILPFLYYRTCNSRIHCNQQSAVLILGNFYEPRPKGFKHRDQTATVNIVTNLHGTQHYADIRVATSERHMGLWNYSDDYINIWKKVADIYISLIQGQKELSYHQACLMSLDHDDVNISLPEVSLKLNIRNDMVAIFKHMDNAVSCLGTGIIDMVANNPGSYWNTLEDCIATGRSMVINIRASQDIGYWKETRDINSCYKTLGLLPAVGTVSLEGSSGYCDPHKVLYLSSANQEGQVGDLSLEDRHSSHSHALESYFYPEFAEETMMGPLRKDCHETLSHVLKPNVKPEIAEDGVLRSLGYRVVSMVIAYTTMHYTSMMHIATSITAVETRTNYKTVRRYLLSEPSATPIPRSYG